MTQFLNRDRNGFTIIEVMIVLAIAGLIMVVVFLAIPQLQRTQRNNARQAVMNRVATEINNFASNNSGAIPSADNNAQNGYVGSGTNCTLGTNGGFYNRYICSNANSFTEPSDGAPFEFTAWATSDVASVPNDTNGIGRSAYRTNALCANESTTTTGASGRNFAVITRLEGGALYCLDNG